MGTVVQTPPSSSGPRRSTDLLGLALSLVLALLLTAGTYLVLPAPPASQGGSSGPSSLVCASPSITDRTSLLGSAFTPGIVGAIASNRTEVLMAGNRGAHPALVSLTNPNGTATTANLSSLLTPYFPYGGYFGEAWNGSVWMMDGTTLHGYSGSPFLVELAGAVLENLTSLIAPFFPSGGTLHDHGLYTLATNGTSYLLGGNNSQGAVLLSVHDGSVTDLSSLLPPSSHGLAWVQEIAWNGNEWLIGGFHVLGTLGPKGYTDLLGGSPFASSGVFGAAWNGSAWMVGGGRPASVLLIANDALVAQAPSLPTTFGSWVNTVVPVGPDQWLVAGNGTVAGAPASPATVLLCGSGSSWRTVDLTDGMPSSIAPGQVQWGACIPNVGGVLLGGGGAFHGVYNYARGSSSGALVLLQFAHGCSEV